MAKNNIRSIRFSDELADLIDRQIGETFTQKFESLIYRAFWELPQQEKRLAEIDQRIQEKTQRLIAMQKTIEQLRTMETEINGISNSIRRIRKKALEIAEEVEKAET